MKTYPRTNAQAITTCILHTFDDPRVDRLHWNRLLDATPAASIYLTWEFQRAWWDTFGEGSLLLVCVERAGEMIALAPLYASSGMVYFVGSAFESDYLGFLGAANEPEVLHAILRTARDAVPGFLGFRLYFLPDRSGVVDSLLDEAARLRMECFEEDDMPAPVLELTDRQHALELANRRTVRRIENAFQREGELRVTHLQSGSEICPHLDAFFDQHIARWAATSTPSRFTDPGARRLIERFTRIAADTGWLRFTRIDWQGRAIAFHYSFCHNRRFYWGMASFDVAVADRSPGQLLIRHLLLAALAEDALCFDFGTGAQPFKVRLASRIDRVRTWGVYPAPSPVPAMSAGRAG